MTKHLVLVIAYVLVLVASAHADQYFLLLTRTAKDTYVSQPIVKGDPTPQMVLVTRNCTHLATNSGGTLYWDNTTDTGVFVWSVLDWDWEKVKAVGQESKLIETGRCNVVELHPLEQKQTSNTITLPARASTASAATIETNVTAGWLLSHCANMDQLQPWEPTPAPKGVLTPLELEDYEALHARELAQHFEGIPTGKPLMYKMYCMGLFRAVYSSLRLFESAINNVRKLNHSPIICVPDQTPDFGHMYGMLEAYSHDHPEMAGYDGSGVLAVALLNTMICTPNQ